MNTPESLRSGTKDALRRLERATDRYGTFSTRDAERCGISRKLLADLARRGVVARFDRGIYGVIPLRRWDADRFAAWRRIGSDAIVSHVSALEVWGLSDAVARRFEVTVPRSKRSRDPGSGYRLHTTKRHLAVHWIEDVPVTSPARSIVDAAAHSAISGEQIELAVEQALERGIATEEEIRSEARPHRQLVREIVEHALERVHPNMHRIDT